MFLVDTAVIISSTLSAKATLSDLTLKALGNRIECLGGDPAQEAGSHLNPQSNIDGRSWIQFYLTSY